MFWHFFTRTYTPFSFPAPDADLSGLTAVVTGASSGVGLETAAHLMRMNVGTLIFGVRDVAKAQKVELELRGRFPAFKGEIRIWEVEMASFESVVAFSKRVEKLDRLHICVLNAGVGASEWKVTADGWEEHLQINVLSTGLLGHLVLPVLARTAESQGNTFKPHLTFTSSMGNYTGKFPEGAHKILGALNDEKTYPSGFGGQHQRYCDGKLVVTHIAQKLAELPGAALVTVNSCCPGWTRSDVRRTLNPWVAWVLNMTCWRTEYGARIIAWSATHETSPGAFIEDCREVEPNAVLKTQKGIDAGDKVWEELVRLWITLDPEVRLMEAAAP